MTDGFVVRERMALVLYGSETGNAQDIADEMGRMTERLRFSTDVINLNAVEVTTLAKYSIVLIAISTTGQGDLPNNARIFWTKILRKKLSSAYLAEVKFAAFGIGDSSYPKYNWAVRKLHRRLIQLGAQELCQRGEGDGQQAEGYETSFIEWLQSLRGLLLTQFPLQDGEKPIPDDCLLPPKWILALALGSNASNKCLPRATDKLPDTAPAVGSTKHSVPTSAEPMPITESDKSGVQLDVLLEQNQRITPESHWQDVRHLVLSTSQPCSYAPGDILTIYPENAYEDVNQIIHIMEWGDVADLEVELSPGKGSQLFVKPSIRVWRPQAAKRLTFRALLTKHLDLNAIPRRSFFALIAHFTENIFQKDRLLEFTKPEFIDELYDYTTRPRRGILEVLQEFDTVKIPWEWAATVLPVLRGRQFSIASGGQLKCGKGDSTTFELLVAVVKYKTVIKKIRQGVCTRYLAQLSSGTKLRVSLHKGDLGTATSDAMRPVIMVGPGTGVAPMRSLIWERYQWAQRDYEHGSNGVTQDNKDFFHAGESILFYGCRNSEADFFFRDEWSDLKSKMPLQVFPAFSRDQKRKIYVQDLIKEQCKLVHSLLYETNGVVYVCGASGKMPQAVRESLVGSFQIAGGIKKETAEAHLAKMEREGRYKQETW